MYTSIFMKICLVLQFMLIITFHSHIFAQINDLNSIYSNASDASQYGSKNAGIYNFQNKNIIILGAHNYFGIKSLNSLNIYAHTKLGSHNIFTLESILLSFNHFTHTKFNIGYHRRLLPNLSGGFAANYERINVNKTSNLKLLNMSISMTLNVNDHLVLSSFIDRVIPVKNKNGLTSPILKFDILYFINPDLIIWLNTWKKADCKIHTIIGLYYRLKAYHFNININPQDVVLSYALGYKFTKEWQFEIGNEIHQYLGISTQTAIKYTF